MNDTTSFPSWTITLTIGRPVTMNHERGKTGHWSQKAGPTAVWREDAARMAKSAGIPPLEQIGVIATPLYKTGRSPQDVGACAPSVKAAIDGLVDAGVIPNDKPDHMLEQVYRPGQVAGVDGLQLTVYDLSGTHVNVHHALTLLVPVSPSTHAELIRRVGSALPDRLGAHASAILTTHLEGSRP